MGEGRIYDEVELRPRMSTPTGAHGVEGRGFDVPGRGRERTGGEERGAEERREERRRGCDGA